MIGSPFSFVRRAQLLFFFLRLARGFPAVTALYNDLGVCLFFFLFLPPLGVVKLCGPADFFWAGARWKCAPRSGISNIHGIVQ